MNDLGFKELYDVVLKTTYPIQFGNQVMEIGETVAIFDKIQVANFQENKKFFSTGSTNGEAAIWWEETKEIGINFTQGIFSKTQLAFLTNAQLLTNEGQAKVLIGYREVLESDEQGRLFTKYPIQKPYFVYRKNTGEKNSNVRANYQTIYTGEAFQEFLVDYYYEYDNGYQLLTIGTPLTNGYLSLEGKTRVKDDTTGQVKTGIIKIPKLKLLSNLSMRLGNDAIPQVGRLDAVAVPTGPRGQKKVMELIFLNDDIDSDM